MAALACDEGGAGMGEAIGHEYVAATPSLDERGAVVARGWARGPLFQYARAAVPEALQEQIREWDFYAIHAPEFAVMVTLAAVRFEGRGRFVIASVGLHDFALGTPQTGSLLLPDTGDVLDLLPTSGGNYRVASGASWLEYADG